MGVGEGEVEREGEVPALLMGESHEWSLVNTIIVSLETCNYDRIRCENLSLLYFQSFSSPLLLPQNKLPMTHSVCCRYTLIEFLNKIFCLHFSDN